MNQYLQEKTERTELRETEGASKAKTRHAEIETRQHEDHLRHFQVNNSYKLIYHSAFFYRKLSVKTKKLHMIYVNQSKKLNLNNVKKNKKFDNYKKN